ncbi:MAG: sulfatase-like hydrolase/transferase [Verrucomicrobia bacterium]|nr:sulfatase-like hydrolase/transferase [Verrucomicrobiota bacterium]
MNSHATNSSLKPQSRGLAGLVRGAALAFVAVCSLLAGPWSLAAARPPNVLFLFSDDQRFDTIHALGNREIQTPNLDRLARRGFAFTHTFCMGAQQGAVCVPSRAMLMTGRSLFRATTTPTGGAIPPALPLWPEVMRRAGYDTIGIGKWHNDRASYARAFAAGGPVFVGGMSDHAKMAVHDFDPTGNYAKENERTATTFSSELFADAAVDFLRQRRRDKPFFLYVAFTAPHDPRTPPKEFADLYPPEKITLPKNFLPEHPFDNGELKVRDEALLPWPRTPDAVRREIAAYYGMITHLDAQIGRVLQALEDSGQADNTIIIFAADNGLAVGRHGLLGKQSLYDHSVRVPLILAGPGVPKGKRSDALCYLFDLFPTVCDLAGVRAPEGLEGRSLAPILRGQRKRVRSEIFGAYRDVQRMVRDERWKLIHYPKIDRWQLFDLRRDPEEIHDHSDDPTEAARLEAMKRKLTELQHQLDDPLAHR